MVRPRFLWDRMLTGLAPFDLDLNVDKFSQELRLTSKTGERFEWQVGAFFTYEDATNTQSLFLRQLDGTKFTGPLAILNTLAVIEIPSTYTEYAGFANATYHFTDQLSLGAGLRYSHDSQDFSRGRDQGHHPADRQHPGRFGGKRLEFHGHSAVPNR